MLPHFLFVVLEDFNVFIQTNLRDGYKKQEVSIEMVEECRKK